MRARSLKPGLFKNELLGSADPLLTILFEGLWCMADREGRLEDRPLRISAEVFPYRREVTTKKVNALLGWLDEHGFIARYSCMDVQKSGNSGKTTGSDQKRYIQVLTFWKHQRPHSNEQPSKIPALSSHQEQPREEATAESTSYIGEQRFALTPSSLNPSSLTPDSPLTATSHQGAPRGGAGASPAKSFEEQEAELRARGLDIWALPGEPGYCGGS